MGKELNCIRKAILEKQKNANKRCIELHTKKGSVEYAEQKAIRDTCDDILKMIGKSKEWFDWIPYDERVPDYHGKYIITVKLTNPYLKKEFTKVMHDCYYFNNDELGPQVISPGFWYLEYGKWEMVPGQVLAWKIQQEDEPYEPNTKN